MSEHTTSLSESPSPPKISGAALLRKAREAEGISLESLATSLKVPISKLEALEADRLDLLPDIVFVRALVSSVCRTLKIESGFILKNFPNTTSPHLKTDESGINTPFHESAQRVDFMIKAFFLRPVVLAVLFLLFGSLLIIFLPLKNLSKITSTPILPASSITPALIMSEPKILENLSQPQSLVFATAPNSTTSKPKVITVENPAFLPETAALASVSSPASSSNNLVILSSTTGLITLKARDSSWVEIIDAKKVVQVRKNLVSGEIIVASGTPPLSVVIGRADAIDVEVAGKSMNLTAISKNNVARFEVK